MIRVKQFIDPTEEDINNFFANTNGRFISFNQSSSNKEVTVEGYRKNVPTILINIVYEDRSSGGMR